MANIFDKIKIPSPIVKHSGFDLSCDHVTTMNFMQPKVVYSKEVVPKESLSIGVENYTRLSPLLAPSFLRARIRTRAFFIKFQDVWMGWNYFISQTTSPSGGVYNNVPKFKNSDFVTLFTTTSNGYMTTVSSGAFDINCQGGTTTTPTYQKYKFTALGRAVYDIMIGLGYKINWTTSTFDTSEYSALPLMCYNKVLNDWYYFNQYVPRNFADELRATLMYNSAFSSSNLSSLIASIGGLKCNYDNDYFTSAFERPSGPGVNSPTINLTNIDSGCAQVNSTSGVTSITTSTATTKLNQYALDALHALSDYLKRNQLAGSQAIDRFAARFGTRLSDSHKSQYLGSDEVNIQFGDVFNTNGASTEPLGTYVGKGQAYGNTGNFALKDVKDFGMLIIVSNIVPRVSYSQGVKRHTMHINQYDFFTPEFDGLGTQAIAMKEIALPKDKSIANNWLSQSSTRNPNSVFGYTPRYAEYKMQLDFVSGNYIYDSTNVGENAWFGTRLFRDGVDDSLQTGQMIGDTTAGTSMLRSSDSSQFERIFADDTTSNTEGNDHFRCIFHFDIHCNAPMLPLFENYEFQKKGQEYLAQLGGQTLHN